MHNADDFQRAADAILSRTRHRPQIGLVLGSGLGVLADEIADSDAIPYEDIPGWPASTVHGHAGRLVIGMLEGKIVLAQQGRAHYYEGYTPQQVTFPIRVMRVLGVQTVILTNAAGGVNMNYKTGDVMMLIDHLNLVGLTGINPLIGPNLDSFGPRFVGMAHPYDRALRDAAQRAASAAGIAMHVGVYAGVSGPMFESPAEVRMLRMLGADVVGMSTVQETVVARHCGMKVLAFSGVTNVAIDQNDFDGEANHEEVLEAGKELVPRLRAIVRGVLNTLA
ncbi:MAG: purine-nucleoside phosphorylase [Anaerolineae bacterium]|nr:purine-nucleoside phosphorylase [Anaerolineae bacterium]NUQ05013.1 purine-nucleoside phosphorylase [Anaerolineae bacterium]